MRSSLFLFGFITLGLTLFLLGNYFYFPENHSAQDDMIVKSTQVSPDHDNSKSSLERTGINQDNSELESRENSLVVDYGYSAVDLEDLKKRLVNYEKLVIDGELDFDLSTALFLYEEHLRSLGYLFSFEDSDYRSYSDAALLSLGEQGDTKALIILSHKLRESYLNVTKDRALSNWQEAIAANHMAVAYGATQPLGTIALAIETQKLRGNLATLSEQQVKDIVLEMLSIYQVGVIRGDSTMFSKAQALVEKYQVDLSEDDKEVIFNKGSEKYREFNAVRIELGLDEYDNSVPVYVAVVDALMKDEAKHLTIPPNFHLKY